MDPPDDETVGAVELFLLRPGCRDAELVPLEHSALPAPGPP
jgi:hypothetical protein